MPYGALDDQPSASDMETAHFHRRRAPWSICRSPGMTREKAEYGGDSL